MNEEGREIEIGIELFGPLRAAAGMERVAHRVSPAAPMHAVLGELAQAHGPEFARHLLDEAGLPRPSILILLNDRPIERGAPPAWQPGDRLGLLPAISGG